MAANPPGVLPQRSRCFVLDLVGGSVFEGSVLTRATLETEVLLEAAYNIGTRLVGHDKDNLLFDGPSPPLHEYLVQPTTSAVHAARDRGDFQRQREHGARG